MGRVIKDHYPNREQTDVARNTSISITFTEAIDPASIIVNTNNSCEKDNGEEGSDGVDFIPQDLDVPNNGCKKIVVVEDGGNIQKDKPFYGGCLGNGAEAVCDTVNTATIRIQKADDEGNIQFDDDGEEIDNPRLPAIVYASYEGANREVKTFRIKPIENLGSPEEHVWHKVEVWGTDRGVEFGVKTARDTNAFGADPDNHYIWEFETGTNIDTTPPTVVSVYPAEGRSIPRNDTVSITFSEPVDPMEVQGTLSQDSSFHNMIFGNASVTGQWKISNGYKTVEFYSDQACGKNTCGDTVYCLPITDITAADEDYQVLVRTATPQQNAATFAGISPGVMDMAGNMLDGDDDKANDRKPAVGDNPKVIDDGEKDPDNYYWEFEVRNEIDLQPPYIKTVTPLVDAQDVGERAALKVTFSKVMQLQTLYDVGIEEYGGAEANLASIWKRPTFERSCDLNNPSNCHTEMTVGHRAFGPQGKDLYYAITTTSTMKSSTGNCFYPGFGPENQNSDCAVEYSEDFPYMVDSVVGCIPTMAGAIGAEDSKDNDTGCAYRVNLQPGDNMQPDRDTCVEHLQDPDISPDSGQPGQ